MNEVKELQHPSAIIKVTDKFYRIIYKGIPFLVCQEKPNAYKCLGFTWVYGTGSVREPYLPPTAKVKVVREMEDTFNFMEECFKASILPEEPLPDYARFDIEDEGMWAALEVLITELKPTSYLGEKVNRVLDWVGNILS